MQASSFPELRNFGSKVGFDEAVGWLSPGAGGISWGAMADTWITDLSDYLDNGRLSPAMPGPARRIAEYLGSIVVALTTVECDEPLGVRCRRRPGKRPCPGMIEGFIEPESNRIYWACLECGDNGLISNWEHSLWDCRGAENEPRH